MFTIIMPFVHFLLCYCYRVNSRRVNKLFMRLAAAPLESVVRLSLLDVASTTFPFPVILRIPKSHGSNITRGCQAIIVILYRGRQSSYMRSLFK